MSDYFHYYYSSRQQIESSFLWNVRFFQKYLDLETSEYQTEMLINFFNDRRLLEQDNYHKMSYIFSQLFTTDSVNRIRSQIKKKNVEIVVTKFDQQDANSVNIQLNSELLEAFGLRQIEQIVEQNQQGRSPTRRSYIDHHQV